MITFSMNANWAEIPNQIGWQSLRKMAYKNYNKYKINFIRKFKVLA